jgi:hypothetical protein
MVAVEVAARKSVWDVRAGYDLEVAARVVRLVRGKMACCAVRIAYLTENSSFATFTPRIKSCAVERTACAFSLEWSLVTFAIIATVAATTVGLSKAHLQCSKCDKDSEKPCETLEHRKPLSTRKGCGTRV